MQPLITKKYVFERKLAGKPIVLDLFDADDRLRKFTDAKALLVECGVHIEMGTEQYRTTHVIHMILPKNGEPYVLEIPAGLHDKG